MGSKSESPGMDDVIKAQNADIAKLSKEGQEAVLALGKDQLAETKRQYDQSYAVSKSVADKQLELMDQAKTQGDDYYNYMVSKQRPIEDALNAQALKDTSVADKASRDGILQAGLNAAANTAGRAGQMRTDVDAIVREAVNYVTTQANEVASGAAQNASAVRASANAFYGQQNKDIDTYKLGNQGIQDLYRADIDADVNNAVADARAGQAQATNSAVRQALRYGISMPAATSALTTSQAQAIASAANGTRNASTDKYRGLIADGIGMRQNAFGASSTAISNANAAEASAAAAALAAKNSVVAQGLGSIVDSIGTSTNMANLSDSQKVAALSANRDMGIQDTSKDWAKKLDVAGLYRGLPGASSGAYSNATAAGNSAVANTIAPSQSYNTGAAQAAGTIGSGYQMPINGLGGALNSQTSIYNNSMQAKSAETGAMYGAAGSVVAAAAVVL